MADPTVNRCQRRWPASTHRLNLEDVLSVLPLNPRCSKLSPSPYSRTRLLGYCFGPGARGAAERGLCAAITGTAKLMHWMSA